MLENAKARRAKQQGSNRTVLDGVFSDAQAQRGQAAYTAHCSVCHGAALDGVSAPGLTTHQFIERWREDTLDNVYNYIRQNMPLGRRADAQRIPDSDYLDILTHILNVNGYRSGSNELTQEGLASVMFVGKNGPQPVPDGALVATVGCLAEAAEGNGGAWILRNATEPVRARRSSTGAAASRLGSLTFRLADLEAVPDFMPLAHKGHRMQAEGYLVRQPNAERINLSSIEMLGSECRQP
jgi:mono/diheme cytochrome c family protein